jgi:hypothetical protein
MNRLRKLLQLFLHGGPVGRNGHTIRPIWQIIVLTPVALLYYPARLYVETVDRYL